MTTTATPADDQAEKLLDPAHHNETLRNVLAYANQRNNALKGVASWGHKMLPIEIAECRKMMALRTPCSGWKNSVAMFFLENVNWHLHPEVVQLFREYVESGLIEVNGLLQCGEVSVNAGLEPNNFVHPLEFAILRTNVESFRLFLEAGSDPTLVPSRDWLLTINTRNDGTPLMDIYEVIAAKSPRMDLVPIFSAIVTESVMQRRIDAEVGDPGLAPAVPGEINRRAARVM
ncbi:hypothetical protein ABIC83_002506 [Roseateles asaccharophilus]|uniref:hypothetical protein n=1 Tax=Roseateles asaccharophilus TaxID=582607 RepID=UPI003836A05F